ncbi:MAG: hypothetical protein N3C60_06835 [Calditerrivibrio sp.]|nr:hypothetical protein [Calditerrivibrio sp.]
MKRFFWLVPIITLFIACSSITDIQQVSINKNAKIYVSTFKNNTETYLAGERASNITKTLLKVKGYNVINILDEKNVEEKYDIEKIKASAKNAGADILVTGEVNEWRYKTGIDGEPAVGLSIAFFDINTEKTIYSAIGAKTGWGHESITTIAQKLVNDLLK